MKTTKLKFTAIALLLAAAFVASMDLSTAKNQPTPLVDAAVSLDLTSEERVIGKYLDDLFAYQNEIWTFKKRQAVRNADLDPLQRKSEDLQNRLSEVQNAVREVVRKLKTANEWDRLDETLLAHVTDANRRSFFQESSFKGDLEYAASNLSSHKDEISLPLDGLRKRFARNGATYGDGAVPFVMAAYHPPTAMFGVGLACRLGQVRLKLITKNGGNIANSPGTCDAISCACRPRSGGLCTGSPCSGAGATQ